VVSLLLNIAIWYGHFLSKIIFLDHSSIGILPYCSLSLDVFVWNLPQVLSAHFEKWSLPCSSYLQIFLSFSLFFCNDNIWKICIQQHWLAKPIIYNSWKIGTLFPFKCIINILSKFLWIFLLNSCFWVHTWTPISNTFPRTVLFLNSESWVELYWWQGQGNECHIGKDIH
jgi:hypothetical protein